MTIRLEKIVKNNYEQVGELHLPEHQQKYLSENIWSIAEALLHETHQARAIYWQDELVGFVMWVCLTDKMSSIWRFMIASEYQNKGIGRKALSSVLEVMKDRDGIEEIMICYGPDNTVAKTLYFSLGFTEVRLNDDGDEAYATLAVRD